MQSMTGFGRGIAPLGNGQIVLEIKTVNHRFLEIRSRTPSELSGVETTIETLTKKKLARGHCTIHVSFEFQDAISSRINEATLESHIASLRRIASRTDLDTKDLLPLLGGAPDLFSVSVISNQDEAEAAATQACQQALDKLLEMRKQEGRSMCENIVQTLACVRRIADNIAELSNDYTRTVVQRHQRRIEEILAEHKSAIDPERIEVEAALLADKADINEEITRLESHVKQMETLIKQEGTVGRRLEFLVQEMVREANTIGSKSSSSEITHLIVAFKGEIEKIREMVQNIE